MLRAASTHVASLRAMKPPMLTMPSFLALMRQPSARRNISWAMLSGVRSCMPGSRSLMNMAFSANRQTSRIRGLPYFFSSSL